MNKWQTIWGKKSLTNIDGSKAILNQLLELDGFDTGFSSIKAGDWNSYVIYIKNKLDIHKNNTIYDVGCGAGAFLYPLYEIGIHVGGIDYSDALISAAKHFMPNGQFNHMEANGLSIDEQYDFVVSNGVFVYFSSYEYAKNVLYKMVKKAKYSVAILEVNDMDKKEQALALRKGYLTDKEYEKRYQGLDHLYYDKKWFVNIAKALDCDIEIEDQVIQNYASSTYRYNVFLKKR